MNNSDKILLQALQTLITVYNNQNSFTEGTVSLKDVMNFQEYVKTAVENFEEKMEELKTLTKYNLKK